MDHSGGMYNLPGTVSGVFFTKRDADAAYDALLRRGHTADDISVLMSDETLDSHTELNSTDYFADDIGDSPLERTKETIVKAIISITSLISLPGLGVAISSKLFKKISVSELPVAEEALGTVIRSAIPEEYSHSYGNSMREGGIIISVDPHNADEKQAIVKEFIKHNGHDILGDDGYSELA
jgi:hypothetical protein